MAELTGFEPRLASGGIPVLRLHYTADPRKRPGTLAGDAWLRTVTPGYPGGLRSPRWRKEMEIEYGALGGTRLFPEWESWQATIVVPPFVPAGWRLYGSYDHGWRRPACYHVHGIGPDGRKATLWEFYAPQVPVASIASVICGDPARLLDGRRFPGNPYAGRETWKRADPEIWHEDQQTDSEFKSISALFRREGVVFQPAERGGDLTIAEWLLGSDWADPESPQYVITTACPNLIRELGQLRFVEHSPMVAQRRGEPEKLVDKSCDAWDSLKYFLQAFPPGPAKPRPQDRGGSFAWWREQARRAADGRPRQTYQREMT